MFLYFPLDAQTQTVTEVQNARKLFLESSSSSTTVETINVNRSLYGSSSRGRVQGGLAALAKLLAALDPTCTTIEAPVYV